MAKAVDWSQFESREPAPPAAPAVDWSQFEAAPEPPPAEAEPVDYRKEFEAPGTEVAVDPNVPTPMTEAPVAPGAPRERKIAKPPPPSVMDGFEAPAPTTTKIEREGAPIRPEVREQLEAALSAMTPDQRAAVSARRDWVGSTMRAIRRDQRASDRLVRRRQMDEVSAPAAGLPSLGEDRVATERDLALGSISNTPERPGLAAQTAMDLERGFVNLKGMGQGLIGLYADSVGAEALADEYLSKYLGTQEEAQKLAPVIGDYRNIRGSPENAVRYAIEAVAGNLATFIPSLLMGGIGGGAARTVAVRAVADMIDTKIKAGMTRIMAERAVASAINKQIGRGSVAGAATGSMGMMQGSIFGDIYAETGQKRPGLAAGMGAIAGALDALPNAMILQRVLGIEGGKAVTRAILARVGLASAKQFLAEGGTEILQTALEEGAVRMVDGQPLLTPEFWNILANAGLQGGIAGGAIGSVSEVVGSVVRPEVRDLAEEARQRALRRWGTEGLTPSTQAPTAPGTPPAAPSGPQPGPSAPIPASEVLGEVVPEAPAQAPEQTATQASPQNAGVPANEVGEIALQAQRDAGWDTNWPFIPADLLNADFRQLIENDPSLTAEEKQRIFVAGRKLGVVPSQADPPPAPGARKGTGPHTPEEIAADDAARLAANTKRQRDENQSSVDKKNAWIGRIKSWFEAAQPGDTITDKGTEQVYKVVEKIRRRDGKRIKTLVAVDERGEPLLEGRGATDISIEGDRSSLYEGRLDEDTGAALPLTPGNFLAVSLGYGLEAGTHEISAPAVVSAQAPAQADAQAASSPDEPTPEAMAKAAKSFQSGVEALNADIDALTAAGINPEEWLGQGDVLGREYSPETQQTIRMFAEVARDPVKLQQFMRAMGVVDEATEGQPAQEAVQDAAQPGVDNVQAGGQPAAGPGLGAQDQGGAGEGAGLAESPKSQRDLEPEQRIEQAREQTNPEPTPAQAEAGNYAKGHLWMHGMNLSLENRKGSTRRGVDTKGKAWETKMAHDYGYFRGTVGKDKDHIDVFIGPQPDSTQVWVIDQKNPNTGVFDEHKVILGTESEAEALGVYKANYPKGWRGVQSITGTDVDGLKKWFASGQTKRRFALYDPSSIGDSNAQPTTGTSPVAVQDGRGVSRSQERMDASSRPADRSRLAGLPATVTVPGVGQVEVGPYIPAKVAAREYMEDRGLPYNPPTVFERVDEERAKRIAAEYERMKHDPQDPMVAAAYEAMIEETLAQYQFVKKTGLKISFIDFAKDGDPYAASPRLAIEDVKKNNHLWVFPTDAGFGNDSNFDPKNNPLLAKTDEYIGDRQLLANDVFRIVHDFFGHIKEGNGFRADGEENAWLGHSAMYSPLARRAMTSETRGQNSWLNYGPHGEKNRSAKTDETVFADQKTGLMPDWVTFGEQAGPRFNRSKIDTGVKLTLAERGTSLEGILLGSEKIPNGKQTVLQTGNFLQARTLRTSGVKERGKESAPKVDDQIARIIAHDVLLAMRSAKHGAGWYKQKIDNALRIAALVHPEIGTDPEHSFMFTVALAITSNGQTIAKNVDMAFSQYREFAKTGKFDTEFEGGGTRRREMKNSFSLMNRLVGDNSVASVRHFLLTKLPARELFEDGYKLSELRGEEVYGGTVLGSKVGGAFLQNLNGNFDALTMDRWFMRTWGRIVGELTYTGTEREAEARDDFIAVMAKRGIKGDPLTVAKAKYADASRRSFENMNPVEKAARRYVSASGMRDSPSSGGDRSWMRKVIARVQTLVNSQGQSLDVADIQAVLWYAEKEAYGKFGATDETADPTDYEQEAVKYASKWGVDGKRIEQAIRDGRPDRGDARSGEQAGAEGPRFNKGPASAGRDARFAGEAVPEVGEDTPVFNSRPVQEDAGVFVGIHYGGTKGLTALDGNQFDKQGQRSAEAALNFTGYLAKRVYFYAQLGPTLPEREMMIPGAATYRVKLINILHFGSPAAQPIMDAARTAARKTDPFGNAVFDRTVMIKTMEQGVINAGYDGYFVPVDLDPRGVVMVIGIDSVPVEHLGTAFEAKKKVLFNKGLVSTAIADMDMPGGEPRKFDDDETKFQRAAWVLANLARNPNFFRYPTSTQKSMAGIAKDVDPGLKVEKYPPQSPDLNSWYEITLPPDVTTGKPRGKFQIRDYKNGTIQMNVAGLDPKKGGGGALAYQLAAEYARNNGKRFDGDVDGLEPVAHARRAEAMISSFLKSGSASHMDPHPYMIEDGFFPDENDAIDSTRALKKWRKLDSLSKLALTIRYAYGKILAHAPADFGDIRYDFANDRFYHLWDSSKALGPKEFAELARRPGLRPVGGGSSTLRRAAIVHTLLQGMGEPAQWAAAMDVVRRGQHGEHNRSLDRIAYNVGPAPAGSTLSPSDARLLAESVIKRWKNPPKIVLHDSLSSVESALRDAGFDTSIPANRVDDSMKGFYLNGEVHIVLSTHKSQRDLYQTLAHEAVGHYGVRALLGNQFDRVKREIIMLRKLGNKSIEELYQSVLATHGELSPEDMADEIIARAAEAAIDANGNVRPGFGWFKRVLAQVAAWLRAHGIDVPFTYLELQGILAQSARNLERGRAAMDADGKAFNRDAAAPVFYSALQRKLEESKQGSAPAAQWKGVIKSLPGIKHDEIEWTGINEWLDTQTGKVTREQVLGFLRANGVKVEEVTLGGELTADFKTRAAAEEFLYENAGMVYGMLEGLTDETVTTLATNIAAEHPEFLRPRTDSTKYGDRQLPGGENYRELLLTLPQPEPTTLGDVARALFGTDANMGNITSEQKREVYAAWNSRSSHIVDGFRSSHFDQPNILAHVRFNERTDADGKRVLFIEEFQSDWAQKGRKQGFGEPAIDEGMVDRWLETNGGPIGSRTVNGKKVWLFKALGGQHDTASATSYDEARAEQRAYAKNALGSMAKTGGIPSAPFVGKTEAWVALSLKRMIRYAVDNGFDRVAWTTGEQQADRYDLSKQISKVEYNPAAKVLRAYDLKGFDAIVKHGVEPAQIADYVGKDVAEKLLNAPIGPRSSGGGDKVHSISGDGLKVGGEGMIAFYDKIVPNVANDLLKKMGGGKVTGITIDVREADNFATRPFMPEDARIVERKSGDGLVAAYQVWVQNDVGAEVVRGGNFETRAAAQAYIDKNNPRSPQGTQPGFDLTPEMASHAARGMPLFNRGDGNLKTDNPGGEWLEHKKAQFNEPENKTKWGTPRSVGTVTGYFNENITLPMHTLVHLRGLSGEDLPSGTRKHSLEWLREKMKGGTLPDNSNGKEYAPFVVVDQNGKAWVSEGNHRIKVAKELGWKSMPVEVRYFNGGETVDGPWHPDRLPTTDGPRLNRGTPARQQKVGLLDAALRLPGKYISRYVTEPVWARVSSLADRIIPEKVKQGVVSDYGLPEPYLDAKMDRAARTNQLLRNTKNLLNQIKDLDRQQARVAYLWMADQPDLDAESRIMDQLPAESRATLVEMKKAVSQIGQEAVNLGLMEQEVYDRNNLAYLHRSYKKHESVMTSQQKAGRALAVTIKGDQFKGRGLRHDMEVGDSAKGDKYIRYERRDPPKPGERLGVLRAIEYIPVGNTVPERLESWRYDGVWEARYFDKQGMVGMWRDFTLEERQFMGEIDEVRYAFGTSMLKMVRDVENARFLQWVATEHSVANEAAVEANGGTVILAADTFGSLRTFNKKEWVQVPSTTIPGTGLRKYGALAGRYIPGIMFSDIRQQANPRAGDDLSKAFQALLRFWKISKTSLSPAVHTNNVMSNFIMADLADVRGRDIARALHTMYKARKGDPLAKRLVERFEDSGGDLGNFVHNELRVDLEKLLLKELEQAEADTSDGAGQLVRMAQVLDLWMHGRVREGMAQAQLLQPTRALKWPFSKMIEIYGQEDTIFRVAKFLKEIEEGATDRAAGKAARDSFLNYEVNAPWIAALRRTVFPFIAFSYRAIPMLVNAAVHKPWKFAKYAAVGGGLNALSYLMMGLSGDDEDAERRLLPDELKGTQLGIFPRLLRMPWNDQHGSPIFLDVRRWIPAGDVFETQKNAAIPAPQWLSLGGPLAMVAEMVTNKSAFTGKPIVGKADTKAESFAKVLDYQFKFWIPNLPLPNPVGLIGEHIEGFPVGWLQTYSMSNLMRAGKGVTDSLGREKELGYEVMNSFGVKMRPYAEDQLRKSLEFRLRDQVQEIDSAIHNARRQFSRGGLDEKEFDKALTFQQRKKAEVQQSYRSRTGLQ